MLHPSFLFKKSITHFAPACKGKTPEPAPAAQKKRPPAGESVFFVFYAAASVTLDSTEYMPEYPSMHSVFMSSSVSKPVKL